MIGKYNYKLSWEKSQVFDLDNGARVYIEVDTHHTYGDMISCIEFNNNVWHCHNGLKDLPKFANDWKEKVTPNSSSTLVRPRFEKVWE